MCLSTLDLLSSSRIVIEATSGPEIRTLLLYVESADTISRTRKVSLNGSNRLSLNIAMLSVSVALLPGLKVAEMEELSKSSAVLQYI